MSYLTASQSHVGLFNYPRHSIYFVGFSRACLARIALARASIFPASLSRFILRSRSA